MMGKLLTSGKICIRMNRFLRRVQRSVMWDKISILMYR